MNRYVQYIESLLKTAAYLFSSIFDVVSCIKCHCWTYKKADKQSAIVDEKIKISSLRNNFDQCRWNNHHILFQFVMQRTIELF